MIIQFFDQLDLNVFVRMFLFIHLGQSSLHYDLNKQVKIGLRINMLPNPIHFPILILAFFIYVAFLFYYGQQIQVVQMPQLVRTLLMLEHQNKLDAILHIGKAYNVSKAK